MTEKLDRPEPDAHLFKHRYVYSDRQDDRIATASLDSTDEHDIAGDVEALWGSDTIQSQKEDVRERIHERIQEFQEEYRDVPYPVKEIIDEELDRFGEVFNGE